MATIDLGLLSKNAKHTTTRNIPAPPPPIESEPEEHVVETEKHFKEEVKLDEGGFTLGREDDATFDANEHKFEGSNASILSTPVETPEYTQPRQKENIEKEEPVPEQTDPVRVLVIGGNDRYYRNTLEALNTSTPDIKFVKQMPSDDMIALQAIDSLDIDIVLIWAKTNMVDAARFWNTVCNSVASDGQDFRTKFKSKRVIVVIPNDISSEISLRNAGLSWFVNETNPQRHEVNVDNLIEVIRAAYNDIEKNTEEEEPTEAQSDYEPNLEEITAPTDEPQSQEMVTKEPIRQEENIENTDHDVQAEPPIASQSIQEEASASRPTTAQRKPAATRPISRTAPKPPAEEPKEEEEAVIPQKPKRPIQARLREMEEGAIEPTKLIGVYSVTGGAGTTTCAVNLASILAKFSNNEIDSNYRVLLIEYNLSCQCADIFFNIKPQEKNLFRLAQEAEGLADAKGVVNIDSEKFKPIISKYVTHDDKTGLDILFGLRIPPEFDYISTGFTKSLLNAVRGMYDVVIVDLSADMAKRPILDALEELDTVYYIMPMDVASIRNAQQIIPLFKSIFRLTPERIKIILNKVIEDNREFDVDQVYRVFRKIECEPEGTIPYDADGLVSSLNRGVPIAIEAPNHPVSQALYSIAVGINPMLEMSNVGAEEEKPKKKGFFGKLFGGGKKKKKKSAKEERKELKPKKPRVTPPPTEEEEEPEITVKDNYPDEEEQEEKPKKKSFFGSLFGGGKKKKKDKKKFAKRKEEIPEEENPVIEEQPEEEAPRKKQKSSGGLFAKLAGMLSFGKKIGVKKNKKVGLLKSRSEDDVEDNMEEEETRQPARQSRLQPRRRRPIRK